MKSIASTDNYLIKQIIKLSKSKQFRNLTQLFVCESFRIINTFIALGYKPKAILVSKDSRYFPIFAKNNNAIEISNKIYHHISNLENGDGTFAIFNMQKIQKENKPNNILIFDNIQNPNNLGSILRSAKAFNIKKIYLTNECVDLFNPKVIQSSMGYGFNIDIEYYNDLISLINMLKKKQYKIYATALNKNAIQLENVSFKNSVIIFGNEGKGLKDNIIKLANKLIYIKINEKVDSLNLSNAAAIIMYRINNENN